MLESLKKQTKNPQPNTKLHQSDFKSLNITFKKTTTISFKYLFAKGCDRRMKFHPPYNRIWPVSS